ncbi:MULTISPECIES: rRNA maturation RNase YbeY [unclassified Paenibacillus]|uniref:rRNA maturation RNase YbeY n=1 Tax=unclassified Paenibacillus TaxID=185978 RepID=UPI001AE1CEE0|nr:MULTISPECIES: rRNA maturation RNase YbeY [unclassified Paenibacillus]MBP1156327.1 putative rRNA maturation factor [Paenibacillus sp. PvP091]MBP1168287.1 putative rRNA maturation factor [Paenibacillus sp. PvR098]MBP2439315.1 putative rRNA maturation factor [Paenibacillus sp. PvP052]
MSLMLSWNNEQEIYEITPALIEKLEELLRLAGALEQVTDGEVALTFTDDAVIQELNKQYRGLDKPTDVLSFAMQEMGDDEIEIIYGDEDDGIGDGDTDEEDEEFDEPLGDIIISVPRAIAQAEDYGHSIDRELGFLFVHGFLHLIGYDHQDEDEEQVMFAKQEQILQQAGLTR